MTTQLWNDSMAAPTPPASPFGIGGQTRGKPKANPSPFGVAGTSTFDGGSNNLLSTQVNPINSAATNRATGMADTAANKLAGFQFSGFQPVAQPNYAAGTSLINQGNQQMQSVGYDYSGANSKYDQAASTLAGARGQASGLLGNVAGLGLNAYTGGGAAHADTSGLNAGLDQSNQYIGGKFAYQGDTGDARAQALASLKTTANGPDRDALASRSLALLEQQSQPGYQADLRAVNQKSAAQGRRGSGMTTNDLGTVSQRHEQGLAQARESAAIDSAGHQLQDNIDRTNLGLNVTTGFGNEDRSAAGVQLQQAGQLAQNANSRFAGDALNANLQNDAAGRAQQGALAYANNQRGIANDLYGYGADAAGQQTGYGNALTSQANNRVGLATDQAHSQQTTGGLLNDLQDRGYKAATNERDTSRADEYNQYGATQSTANTLHGYQTDAQTQDANNRNELRTERGYQTQRSDQAVQDERNRLSDEEMLRNGVVSRGQVYNNAGNGAPSPVGAYQNGANTAQGQADQTSQGLGTLVANYAAGRRRTGAGTGAVTRTGTTNNGPVYA